MKKIFKLGVTLIVMAVFLLSAVNVFAATIGQQLTSPEAGWQRIDDADSKFIFSGSWSPYSYSEVYNGSRMQSNINGASVSFKFTGTKLRLISECNTATSSNLLLTIDGVTQTISQRSSTIIRQCFYFEKTGLSNDVHTVSLKLNDNNWITFDAIDIDETGKLISYYQPTLVSATSEDKKITLKWSPVDGATGYNVKKATVAGGPYETVANNVYGTTYDVTGLTNGTTYYFVVSALYSGGESPNSNELSATPSAPTTTGNRALLEITMTNGERKEYDMSSTEIAAFLKWYADKSHGVGEAYYTINKNYNIGPFSSRKEYIAYDKISSFEVMDYNK